MILKFVGIISMLITGQDQLKRISQEKITKMNNSKMRKCRVIVLVHCTTQWDLFTYGVSNR